MSAQSFAARPITFIVALAMMVVLVAKIAAMRVMFGGTASPPPVSIKKEEEAKPEVSRKELLDKRIEKWRNEFFKSSAKFKARLRALQMLGVVVGAFYAEGAQIIPHNWDFAKFRAVLMVIGIILVGIWKIWAPGEAYKSAHSSGITLANLAGAYELRSGKFEGLSDENAVQLMSNFLDAILEEDAKKWAKVAEIQIVTPPTAPGANTPAKTEPPTK